MTRARLLPACLVLATAVLPACTSTDVLEPSAIATGSETASTNSATTSSVAPETATATGRNSAAASLPASRRLQFAPIIGTPIEAAAPLTTRLAQRARERGLTIAAAGDARAYTLKGYFSALPEGKETTIVYVWDVLDSTGNRLHRIQGQQVLPGGEGWSSVSPPIMEAIADQTMEQLAGWLGRDAG